LGIVDGDREADVVDRTCIFAGRRCGDAGVVGEQPAVGHALVDVLIATLADDRTLLTLRAVIFVRLAVEGRSVVTTIAVTITITVAVTVTIAIATVDRGNRLARERASESEEEGELSLEAAHG
jgi:hypothetical protein